MPRFSAEPVSLYTSSGNAKSVIELPRFEMVCPVQYFQKSLLSLSARLRVVSLLAYMKNSFANQAAL